jgi:serine/threonine protein kinase
MDPLQPGSTLGHYKVLRPIGAGGMGVVYEAEDLRLGRHVALKRIGGSSAPDPTALERFYREARIASSLNHPGICTVYEIDESQGEPFLAMELLDGQTLDRLYAGHPAPLHRLIEIGIQLTDALDAAHHKAVLHRDIKLANIFVTTSGQAKILDFGLARIENSLATDTTQPGAISESDKLTRSGSALGTVAYMSPEQARGESLDARSDLFSLGVVLYEMATGNHPFSGTTSAVVFDKLLNYHPPSTISLNHTLPPAFENIVNKALEKDRDLRYQSASDLRADLRRLQRSISGYHPTAIQDSAAASHPGTAYPGMTRVGSASPAPRLEIVPARSRGPRFSRAWFIGGVVALLVTVSAIAGIRYFTHKRSSAVTNAAASAPHATGTATRTSPAVSPPATAGKNPAATPSQTPTSPSPAPAPVLKPSAKPSAGTPFASAQASRAVAPPSSVPPAPDPLSFAADAGAPAGGHVPPNIPFRRAYAAAPSLTAHHMHFFGGSCTGTLEFKPETLTFTSPVHSFTLTRAQIRAIEGDAVVESGGRRWRFEIPGKNGAQVHNLLARWFAAIPAPR